MQSIGAVDKSVALSAAAFEASQATQSLGLTGQFNSAVGNIVNRVYATKDVINMNNVALMQGQNTLLQNKLTNAAAINQNIMENRYELSKEVNNDGDKTRALITSQYELNLQRQLADANAAIIALQTHQHFGEATRGVEITTTNNINQMQQQTQQQSQYANLAHLIYGLGQNLTNSAINLGSGTQTASPANTNTSIR
jgi:predicted  nucleic acid-binding Zn-ribbon protein